MAVFDETAKAASLQVIQDTLNGAFIRGGKQLVPDTMRLTAKFAKIGSAYPTTHLVLTRTKCIWVIRNGGPPFSGFHALSPNAD